MFLHWRHAFPLLLLWIVTSSVWAQDADVEGHYIFMDIFVATDGSVLFYGETDLQNPFLDLGVAKFPIQKGVFSNTTYELINKVGANWTLDLRLPDGFVDGLISVYLPPGSTLIGVSPPPGHGSEMFPDKGGLVITFYDLKWDEFTVEYQLGQAPPVELGNLLVPILSIVGICILALAGIKILWPRIRIPIRTPIQAKLDQDKWDAISPTLTERERMVVENVAKEGGRISQRKLRHICDLPKSTLSRVTDELQRKGLIRKIPVGQTNEIRLDERLMEGP